MNIKRRTEAVISVISAALEGEYRDYRGNAVNWWRRAARFDEVGLKSALHLKTYDENGFEFDWKSEAAMSKSRSMFRSVGAFGRRIRKFGALVAK